MKRKEGEALRQTSRTQRAHREADSQVLGSLFRVAENEFPKFEISQTDSVLVTLIHNDGNLVEQSNGFRFRQSLLAADVGMQVPI